MKVENVLEISAKGRDLLFSEYLNNVDFVSLTEENNLEVKENNNTIKTKQIIYIPKDFDKKV